LSPISQETSAAGVCCAGDPTGMGGLDKALEDGKRAGAAATGQAVNPSLGAFVRDLAAAFHLDPGCMIWRSLGRCFAGARTWRWGR